MRANEPLNLRYKMIFIARRCNPLKRRFIATIILSSRINAGAASCSNVCIAVTAGGERFNALSHFLAETYAIEGARGLYTVLSSS